MNYYVSDLHLGHANIIKYCERPYRDVGEMDKSILEGLRAVESSGGILYVLGDVTANLSRFVDRYGWLEHPERHTLIAGNHDCVVKQGEVYARCFGAVVGTEKTYLSNTLTITDIIGGTEIKLLLSHFPQKDLQGSDLNLYGHHHNNRQLYPDRFPEKDWRWLLDSELHINVSIELLGYRPKTLADILMV